MIIRIIVVSLLVACLSSPWGTVADAEGPVVMPAALGDIELKCTVNEGQRAYLGIASEAKFCLAQVRAERLFIVVFNTFCAICQADAHVLNAAYQLIEDDPALKGKTKLVGIATGNTDAEVEHFQQEHQVPFPLFADPGFSLERAFPANMRAPMLITARNVQGKSLEVIKTHVGPINHFQHLLDGASRTTMQDSDQVAMR